VLLFAFTFGQDRPLTPSALDLTNPLPPSVGALSRWTAEPTRYIWLPANSFIPNGKGYPVLSKACQAFLRGMSKVSVSRLTFAIVILVRHQKSRYNQALQA
jgi:protein arginine N-methyltransferase 5